MPIPVSLTLKVMCCPSGGAVLPCEGAAPPSGVTPPMRARRMIVPPGAVNLMALWSRFISTCCIRGGSTWMAGSPGSISRWMVRPARSAWRYSRSTAPSIRAAGGMVSNWRGTRPDSMRASSRSSCTMRARASTSISMRERKRRAAGGSSRAPSSRVSVRALSEASGVRSSCEMLLIKSCRTVSSWRRRV